MGSDRGQTCAWAVPCLPRGEGYHAAAAFFAERSSGPDGLALSGREPRERPGIFYAGRGQTAEVVAAKRICAGCVVREDCLEYALAAHEPTGTWGGLAPTPTRVVPPRVVSA
jgi:Transcription factor WhiB